MVRLSLAMIVKNEQRHLAHCLESVRGLVDEWIVVDTGSTDDTVAIAESFGATVSHFEWIDDFAAARNASLARCTGDWILVLDADESIDPLDHGLIRRALERSEVQGYKLWLRNYMRSGAFVGCSGAAQRNDGKYREGAAYSHHIPRRALRLFRRQAEPIYRSRVHELAESWFEEKRLLTEDLEATIHHFGKIDFEQDLGKQAEYTRLAKAEAEDHPGDPEAHYNVIQQALMIEDWESVLQAARQYLGLKPSAPLLVYLGAAMACQGLGRASESLTYLQPVLAREPNNTAALCARGDALADLGRAAEAQQAYLAAIDQNPAFTLPFLKLSELLERGGDVATARQILEAGLDQNPKDLVLWTSLVGLGARTGSEQVASDAWDALQAVPDGGKGIWHLLVAHGLLGRGARVEARLVLDQGLHVFPGQSELIALKQRIGNS